MVKQSEAIQRLEEEAEETTKRIESAAKKAKKRERKARKRLNSANVPEQSQSIQRELRVAGVNYRPVHENRLDGKIVP